MGAYNIIGASTLVGGQPEDVSQILANLQAIQAVLNGGIDDTNINAAAGIQITKLALGSVGSYTPAWTCLSGAAPAIGNGSIAGTYFTLGKMVQLHIDLVAGTTTTFGGGSWAFNIPAGALTTAANGNVLCSHGGVVTQCIARNNTNNTFIVYQGNSTANLVSATVPFTWATGDIFSLDVTYFLV